MKYIEVEQKFRLLSPVDELKATLTECGAKAGESSRQVDTYFNAPHRDFLGGRSSPSGCASGKRPGVPP